MQSVLKRLLKNFFKSTPGGDDLKSRFQKLAKSPYFPCLKKKKILLKIVADVKESTTTGFTAGEVHLGI